LSYSEIAKSAGVHRTTVMRKVRKARKGSPLPSSTKDKVTVENEGGQQVVTTKGRITTLNGLLKAAGINSKKWRVTKWVANKWDGMGKGGEPVPLWQVKAWLERIPEALLNPITPVKSLPRKAAPIKGNPAEVKTCLVIPDSQNGYRIDPKTRVFEPLHDRRAWDIAFSVCDKLKPDVIVLLGDMLDLAPWGKYTTEASLHQTTGPALRELHWDIAQLRLASPSSRIIYLEGNHEYRIRRQVLDLLQEAADLRPVGEEDGPNILSVDRLLALDRLDVEYIQPYGEEFWLWDLVRFHHGTTVRGGGGATVAAMLKGTSSPVSQIVGHVHRLELAAKTIHGPSGPTTIYAMIPGTIARTDGIVPGVVAGRSTRCDWQQGLGIVSLLPPTAQSHASVTMRTVSIHDGRAAFNGKVLRGRDRIDEIREATGFEWF
jgi:hypothetical protein